MRQFALAHPGWTVLIGLFGLGTMLAYWPLFLTAAVLAGAGFGVWKLAQRYDQRETQRLEYQRVLGQRADYEQWLLAYGYPDGVYGGYPPVSARRGALPVTPVPAPPGPQSKVGPFGERP